MWIQNGGALCLLQLIVVVSINALSFDESKIVGGYETTIANEPYIVQFLRDEIFICGASIITPKFVLTAAHCMYGLGNQPERFKVRAGSTYLYDYDAVTAQVEKFFRHASYSDKTKEFDVAMARLATPLPINGQNINTIPLCDVTVPVGAEVKVSGWGLTEQDGVVSMNLRSVNIKTVSNQFCDSVYMPRINITENMICAAKQGKDSCRGDSGGPMVYDNKLCGIVSFGAGCASQKYPGVYANVLKLRPFIDTVINNY